MVNQVNLASVSTGKSGVMDCCFVRLVNPPPCTRIAIGKGPFPSGTFTSSFRLTPSVLAYSTSRINSADATRLTEINESRVMPTSTKHLGFVAGENLTPFRAPQASGVAILNLG